MPPTGVKEINIMGYCGIHKDRPVDCALFPFYIFPDHDLFYFDLGCVKIQQIISALEWPNEDNGGHQLALDLIDQETWMFKHTHPTNLNLIPSY